MSAPPHELAAAPKNGFVEQVGSCVALLFLIHVLPKGHTPRSPWRLSLTVLYFATLLYLGFQMLQPRTKFALALNAWRFADCPPLLERAWRRHLFAKDRVLTVVVYLLITFLLCTALSTLNLWFTSLDDLALFYTLGWWLSLLGLYWFLSSPLTGELWQTRRALHRQLALWRGQGYEPRPLAEFWNPPADTRPPVTVLGPDRFAAGGIDWHWGDFKPNAIVFGQPGAGKTQCVLNALLDGLLGAGAQGPSPASALIMDPKGDFLKKIQNLCAKWGRAHDLKVLDLDENPGYPTIRWNPLDTPDDELELAARCGTVMETLGMRDQDSSYWIDSAKKFIEHAIGLLRLTNPADQPPSFPQIGRLAARPDDLRECLARLPEWDRKGRRCMDYFVDEWLELGGRLRTDVMTFISNMVHPFLVEPYATLFSGRSTLSVAQMIDAGTILYLHLPTARRPAMARTVGTFVKLEYFEQVRRRVDKPRPSFFLCDEFPEFASFGQGQVDARFFSLSRQSNHGNIVAAQNINSFLMQAGQEPPVLNLLGNCAVKVFLRNTDAKTNQFASELYGQELVEVQGVNYGTTAGRLGKVMSTLSGSDQWSPVVRPELFTRLAVPEPAAGRDHCEGIVHLGSRAEVQKRAIKLRWPLHPL